MKALTVQQPWAWAVATGHKLIENRVWSTTHRGPLAIHAGLAEDRLAYGFMRIPLRAQGVIEPGEDLPDQDLLAKGVVLAVADLVDVCMLTVARRADCGCGPWAEAGKYHWRLKNVRPLATPVPMRGRLGLWNVDLPTTRGAS